MSLWCLESLDRCDGRRVLHPLVCLPLTVGRSHTNDLMIDAHYVGHSTVSLRHARIEHDQGDLIVVDLKSKNGVYVDGRRTGESILRANTTLACGRVRFRVHRTLAADLAEGLCLRCGAANRAGARFCARCGNADLVVKEGQGWGTVLWSLPRS